GSVTLTELPRFPDPVTGPDRARRPGTAGPDARHPAGSLVAPLPGTVGRVAVAAGQRVAAGDLLLTLEAMKLEHPVLAPHAGTVAAVPVSVGQQVDAGAVLVVIEGE